jgi:VCBS repeat-containing protein
VANDSDVDSSTLSVVSLSAPLHGSAVLNADGTVTYTPDANYFGTDSFTYRTNDGQADSANVATVSISITPVNDAPIAVDDTATTPEDTAVVLNLVANDSDVDSGMLSVVSLSAPLHGSAVLNADGTVSYTPDANYFGPDSFTYRTNDGQADSANVATVSITITTVNDAPIAVDDTATTPEDTLVVLDLLANDSDADSSTLSVVSLSAPLHGSAVLNADGTVSYTPDANYFGTDSFTYRTNDGQADSTNVATVSITITPVNDAPIAVDDTATTPEDTAVVLNLVANDSDIDSSTLSVVSLSAPLHGSTVLNADGTVSYTPDANYFGPDSFTYRSNDGQTDSANVATVSITITTVNDAPIAIDDTATTPEDTAVVLNLVANDSDVDSGMLSVVSLSAPLHGSAVLNADGTVSYTPDANYFGTDSFTYRSNDGQTDSANVATVSITITPVNDRPTIDLITGQTVDEGNLLSFSFSASDIENDSLYYSLDAAPSGATLDASSGRFSWVAVDGPATVPVTVRVTDAHGASDIASFDISVRNVAPTLTITGAADVTRGQPYTLDLSASDPGHDTISGWIINWGDGAIENFAGNPPSVSHTYSSAGSVTLSASAADEDGSYSSNTLGLKVTVPETLRVSQFTPTNTGFQVRFNRAIDPAVLNLYDTERGGLGAADVSLTGSGGLVKGSIVVDADGRGLTFIRSGGVLAPDAYTVRLESGAMALQDTAGSALDGNGDGSVGDAFITSFSTAAMDRTLSLPDFMRGPGQFVDLTAPSQGGYLPLYLSDGAGVTSVEFTLHYDPAQLELRALSAGVQLPASAIIERLPAADGILKVRISSPTALVAGKVHLLNLLAFVPTTAAYGTKQVLDLDEVRVNGLGATDDDALHLVGYLGDSSGNAAYSTLDGQQIQRVLVKLDSGFAAYPNVDPLIVADINGSGTLTSIDASRVLQEVSYLTGASSVDRLEIPAIPAGIGALKFSGPDPRVDIPVDAVADPGELVTVPIRIDTTAGLESVQLRIGYDASRFEVVGVRRGTVSGDFDWFISGQEPGRITVDMSRLDALPEGSGTLLDLDLRIRSDALPGVSPIDLQYASLNDGRLTLNVVPQPGADETDGRITIRGKTVAELAQATAVPASNPAQATLPLFAAGEWSAPALAGSSTPIPPVAPVIDLSASFSLPTAVSEALVADNSRKPWLKDYLGNVGQARKASPNSGLKITTRPAVPAATAVVPRGM